MRLEKRWRIFQALELLASRYFNNYISGEKFEVEIDDDDEQILVKNQKQSKKLKCETEPKYVKPQVKIKSIQLQVHPGTYVSPVSCVFRLYHPSTVRVNSIGLLRPQPHVQTGGVHSQLQLLRSCCACLKRH